MSRCGRSQDFLNEWKEGAIDLDTWDVVVGLDAIDPFFRQELIKRLANGLAEAINISPSQWDYARLEGLVLEATGKTPVELWDEKEEALSELDREAPCPGT